MSSTLLEQTRAAQEDVERLERLIVKDLKQDLKAHKEKLHQDHRVRQFLDGIHTAAAKLVTIYEDDDGARKDDIAQLAGSNVYGTFYERLKEIKDYHRRFTTFDLTKEENDEYLLKVEPPVFFTGEEGMGRYLDLHALFMQFLNGKFATMEDMTYLDYVNTFLDFETIPRSKKFSNTYRQYLDSLLEYLKSVFERTQPLADWSKHEQRLDNDFDNLWESGEVIGWEDKAAAKLPDQNHPDLLDLEAFATTEELETVGAEKLKVALQALGLKCGGTLRQRAERLMTTKGKSLEQIDKKLFAKGVIAETGKDYERRVAVAKAVAKREMAARKLAELMKKIVDDTKQRVEAKLAMTAEELEADKQEQEHEVDVPDSDEEDEYVYNPLNLPLGWDGKPIPYWLYKLHGLNQEFTCEICGGHTYRGRREFEKHFKEWRHQNGMKALGIPNNKMFFEVTKIDDAKALWKAIQDKDVGSWKPEVEEEFEDADGNVYSKKTFEDLKRQGLI